MVYVLDKKGKPLMPTKRHRKVRKMLESGKAKVIKTKPFTIQLTYEPETKRVQEVKLGIDSGYTYIGFSAITEKEELISGELQLLSGMKKRLKQRAMYRRQRRNRLRYRKPRFDNRRRKKDWLAPSLQHKLDGHLKFIEKLQSKLPISEIVIEIANFDIQKIKNPAVVGEEYQQGEKKGFWNLREYILHRDNHTCQNPNCKNKAENPILEVHHLGFSYGNDSDRVDNLITLCDKCHTPANHKKDKFLHDWKPKLNSFTDATFMNTIRWKLVNQLKENNSNIDVKHTYGYLTKSKRINLGLEKTHYNDAFCIVNGSQQRRICHIEAIQVRRNNRSLEKFYDAKYNDLRTSKKASGQELSLQRRGKRLDNNIENLRVHRGYKIKAGRRSIRKKRYPFQPNDTVIYSGMKTNTPVKCKVKGAFNKGSWVRLIHSGRTINSSVKDVVPYSYGKGYCFL